MEQKIERSPTRIVFQTPIPVTVVQNLLIKKRSYAPQDLPIKKKSYIPKELTIMRTYAPQYLPIKKRIYACNEDFSSLRISLELKTRLQTAGASLMIKKNLTKTDVNGGNCRLAIPDSQIINHNFLTYDEFLGLSGYYGSKERRLHVTLIDPSGIEWDIRLSRWMMGANAVYNLISPWNNVVARNNLRENTLINVYSFREGPKLYFAVIKV